MDTPISVLDQVKRLSSTSYSITYLVRDADGVLFVKKVLTNRNNEQSRPLVSSLQGAESPFLTKVLSSFLFNQDLVLLRHYVTGDSLSSLLSTTKLSSEDIWIVLTQIVLGLHCLHNKGIGHGNLNLNNVLLPSNDTFISVLLSDYGLLPNSSSSISNTLYVAPEVVVGQESTTATDIWSLGVLLHFLVYTTFPFQSVAEVMSKQLVFDENDEFSPLLARLFVRNPLNRITIDEILELPKIKDVYNTYFAVEATSSMNQHTGESKFKCERDFLMCKEQLSDFEKQQALFRFSSNPFDFLKHPNDFYQLCGSRVKFIQKGMGCYCEVSHNDCRVGKDVEDGMKYSFVAINHPNNGTITLTLESTSLDTRFQGSIGYTDPSRLHTSYTSSSFRGIIVYYTGVQFKDEYLESKMVTSPMNLGNCVVHVSFTDTHVTYSTPHTGWSRTVERTVGWVFGIFLMFKGESWSVYG
ncbi:hypothetical protein RCL1_007877 [Eukaryota sp. TZLM3-RCL]